MNLTLQEDEVLITKLKLTIEEQQKLIEDLKDYEPIKEPFNFTDFFEQYKMIIFIIGGFLIIMFLIGGKKR